LVEDGLAGESDGGEFDVAEGHVGDEAAGDVVGEMDTPRRVRRGLRGGQRSFVEPAADRLGADAELAGGFMDGHAVAGIGSAGPAAICVRSRMPGTREAVKGQAGRAG
jgi:hypothetical protein